MTLKDITIKDFAQMNKFIDQWQKDNDENKFEQSLIDLFKLNHLPIHETNKIVSKLMESLKTEIIIDYSELSHNSIKYKLVNFDKIKVGRFLDADNYVNEPSTLTNFMVAVFDDGFEYEGTSNKKDIFDDVPCIYLIYAKNKFMEYKLDLVTRFKYLYKEIDEDDQYQERQLNGNFSIGGGEEDFQNEFGWYSMLYTFSKEQYMSIRDVVDNIYADEFLTFINFFKRKCELDNIRIQNSNKH